MIFSSFIGHLEVYLFRRWWTHRDDDAGLELARFFFDLQYLRKFGIPGIPQPDPLPPPFREALLDPTPTPIRAHNGLDERLRFHEFLLQDLIGIAAGDPSPQPSIVGLLRDPAVRLEAAKNLHERLQAMIEGVAADIERLEAENGQTVQTSA